MKGSIFAAAAVVGSALADGNLHRRHDALHNKRAVGAPAPVDSSSAAATPSGNPGGPLEPAPADETCGCTTKVITVWGSPTLVPIPQTSTEETTTSTSTVHSTSTSTKTLTVTPSASVAPTSVVPTTSTVYVSLPTNGVTSFSTTGTYTVPATTLTVTESTTVCGATTTNVPSGTHTVGGVTTVVETDTVITCPYATVKPTGTTETSVIEYTTYTCPAAGTYTVVPGTVTTVPSSTVIVYPTPSTLTPGTYTKPETTITATRTDTTFYCPFSEETTSAPAVASTTAPAPVTTTSAPAPAATTSSSSGGSGSGLTGEGQYGMTFSPYTESGACMTKDEVKKNLQTIKNKGFNLVRIYSTDCSGLEFVGEAAKDLGLQMIVGVYIDSSGKDKAQEQVDAISKWAQWGLVELVVVGNEAASMGYMDAKTLGLFIQSSAAQLKEAGWTGKVTTTEPIDIWQTSGKSDLCPYVDIVGANIHPFFNAETSASAAGTFALAEYKLLEAICGKDVINLETGWPNAGDANGLAIPSVENQKTAVQAIAKTIGSKSIFFSYADDAWKPAGQFGVEKHWGCASVF